ncbi:unnamed protein product [Pseudo-nitzschia multistriata]|uniref:Uncharacterized protein n=1 Tax=Pseudo-nitzschia multistriata TaxID=183589 RepID=A0A448ZQ87_9STRA|nr:unnamed protein product [Pseudo-nitzschia multistriata]
MSADSQLGQSQKDNDVAISSDVAEEEYWPAPPLLTGHKIHTIRFGGSGASRHGNVAGNGRDQDHGRVLRYKSMSSEALTPLDMTYSDGNDALGDDEFYDGTGNLMWMAAVCFGHLVAKNAEPLRNYLPRTRHGSEKAYGDRQHRTRQRQRHRVCELGCGTGGAGISLLLFSNPSQNGVNGMEESDSRETTTVGTNKIAVEKSDDGDIDGCCHVVFTDNDRESLELCKSNCELNGLDERDYSHRLLWWGPQDQNQQENREEEESPLQSTPLEQHSFDTVLATDVVYDLKMIAPLFQTVEFLLRKPVRQGCDKPSAEGSEGGHLILSHVPRFCIPRQDRDEAGVEPGNESCGDGDGDSDEPGEAFLELERFIRSEAGKVGLSLVETIRPHTVLSEDDLAAAGTGCDGTRDDDDDDNDNDSMQQLTPAQMKEAHAVVFVFRQMQD